MLFGYVVVCCLDMLLHVEDVLLYVVVCCLDMLLYVERTPARRRPVSADLPVPP